MKKYKIFTAMAVVMIFIGTMVGCGPTVNEDVTPGGNIDVLEDSKYLDDEDLIVMGEWDCDYEVEIATGEDFQQASIDDIIAGLTKDEYPDLVITVAVLERMAILPGSTVRVNVVIENQGDETIAFTKGSGTNIIPDALHITADGLQPIMPLGEMGMIATMDFNVETLGPGASLNYDLYVRVVEENANFHEYMFALIGEDKDISQLSWEELSMEFPSIIEATPGNYTINVFFLYKIIDEDEELDIFAAQATGFNVGTIDLLVSE